MMNAHGNRNSTVPALVALLAGLLSAAPAAAADLATQIRQLTGAETRIVWIRHKRWEGQPTDHLDGGAGYSIMALDTEEKTGERELVPEGEIYNPLISPNGDRVIYSSGLKTGHKFLIHCVGWNGANSRVLSAGYGMCLWRDPATGIEWVYASNDRYGDLLDRFQLDKPKVREKLYTGPKSHRLSVSADGTRAAGELPWPNAGMLDLRTGQVDYKNYRKGCNVYISPDNSCMVSIMDGSHGRITLYKADGSSRDISVVPPGLKPLKNGGRGVMWNPKWTSDARYMSVAGPFQQLKPDRADIWLGRFADDFNSIPTWLQVTDNDYMDNFAYVWVDLGGRAKRRRTSRAARADSEKKADVKPVWPSSQKDLVFIWRGSVADNQIRDEAGKSLRLCHAVAKGVAWFGPRNQAILSGGALAPRDTDRLLLDACRKSDRLTIELVATPAADQPEGRVALASFSGGPGKRNFALVQDEGAVFLEILLAKGGAAEVRSLRLFPVVPGRPAHLVVSHQPGVTSAFVNGRRLAMSYELRGDLSAWTVQPLRFGREGDGGPSWRGELKSVAVYSRALFTKEVRGNHRALEAELSVEKPAGRIHVKAKLASATPLPENPRDALGTYSRALAVHTYEVEKVLAGTLPAETRRVLVAQWGVLDWELAPGADKRGEAIGKVFELYLDPWEAHPQLAGEMIWNDSEELDLPMFFDVHSDGSSGR
jgi:hypothetical protein